MHNDNTVLTKQKVPQFGMEWQVNYFSSSYISHAKASETFTKKTLLHDNMGAK